MSLVLDSVSASLEGRNGEHQTLMHHQVGELELEMSIFTTLANASNEEKPSSHESVYATQAEAMREQLTTFISTYPTLFDTSSSPMGKISAYKQQKQASAARFKKSNASSRLANMSEVRYERLARGLKTETDRWGRLCGY
jgi:hypothetical protein